MSGKAAHEHHCEFLSVIGTHVHSTTPEDTVDWIIQKAKAGDSCWAAYCTVHMLMEARDSELFRAVLNAADLVNPDGLPVAWMLRLLGARSARRTTGPDTLPLICGRAAEAGVPVGFYGSKPETLQALTASLQARFPALKVAYSWSPPFRALTSDEDEAVVRDIGASGARIIFVGLGCPKQEQWCHGHRGRISAVLLAVGAAFDFHAGATARAPAWMQRIGLEWLHRLAQEPRRLAGRYLVGNTRFLWLALLQLLRLKKFD